MIINFKIYEVINRKSINKPSMTEEDVSKLKKGDLLYCVVSRKKYGAKYGNKYKIYSINNLSVTLIPFGQTSIIRYPLDKYVVPELKNKIKKFYVYNFVPEDIWIANKYNL